MIGHFKIHCGFIAKLSLLWHKYLLYLMCFSLLFQSNFETMFREYELNATFHYLRSFRRVRVDFEAHFAASSAKLSLNGTPLGDNVIQCYFLQVSPIRVSLYFLSLKASNRQKRKFYLTRYCVGKSVNLFEKTVNKSDFLKVINLCIEIFSKDSLVGKTKLLYLEYVCTM